jgi:hypothetical protein
MSTPLDRARALLSQAPPNLLHPALMAGDVPERILTGQLWRARWSDVTALVLVVGDRDPAVPAVVPVTVGLAVPSGSRASTLALEGQVVRGAVVWPLVRLGLPLRTLDALVEHSTETTRAAALASDGPAVPPDVYDPAADLVAELEDDLAALAAAPGLRTLGDDTGEAGSLRSVLPGDTAGKLDVLEEVLGLDQAAAMDLLRAPAALSDSDAAALERHLELEPGALPRAEPAFPQALVTELDHPRWRRQMLARVDEGTDELAARREAASAAYALAARESPVSAPSWRERLDMIFGR